MSETLSAEPTAPARWTILDLVRWSADYLRDKGIESGRLDAEHLLAEALGTERLQLYLQFERPLAPEELGRFKPLLLRRARREPLQYILGRTAFRELEVATDSRVLIPRPETEMLVQEVLDWATGRDGLSLLDLCTGSGVVALSLVKEGPFDRALATDVSGEAIDVARRNARANDVADVEFRVGDLFEALEEGERFAAVVSNPPYVEESARDDLQPEVRDWEPSDALFAGDLGLDVIERIVRGAGDHLEGGGLLALEIGVGQGEAVRGLLEQRHEFEDVRVRRDLSGRPRFVLAARR